MAGGMMRNAIPVFIEFVVYVEYIPAGYPNTVSTPCSSNTLMMISAPVSFMRQPPFQQIALILR
jgi:hypothetical protein